jgi:hypothetical protein
VPQALDIHAISLDEHDLADGKTPELLSRRGGDVTVFAVVSRSFAALPPRGAGIGILFGHKY